MGRTVFYLCQHGDALARDVDPDRPLSKRGTADVCNVAGSLGGRIVIDAIIHSGRTRARQTAELLHERLAPDVDIREQAGLGPKDPVEDFAAVIASSTDNLMMVGHMPFVGRLASHLLCHAGDPDRNIVAFQPGTVVALERQDDGNWMLAWMVTPALC
ncbi:MAG: phosphohistidine phosphatase SixA [Arenicellales bacterium]